MLLIALRRTRTSLFLTAALGAPLWVAGCGGDGGGGKPIPDAATDMMMQQDRPPPDAPTNEAGNYCSEATGPGTIHDKDITASETWGPLDNPHIVKKEILIGSAGGATLTIDGCTVIKFESGAGLKVGPAGMRGDLRAAPSDRYHPITFTGTAASAGSWKGIYLGPGADSSQTSLKNATIEFAGGGDWGGGVNAALFLEGTGKGQSIKPSPQIETDNLIIRGSGGYGIYATKNAHVRAPSGGGFVEIKGNKGRPVRVEAENLGFLPTGTFSGNDDDKIEIQGGDGTCVCSDEPGKSCSEGLCVRTSTNWGPRGVPYHVKGIVHVGKSVGGLAMPITLTIAPGLKFLMAPDAGFEVGLDTQQKGALRIQGDKMNPVVFTPDSGSVTAGHWRGITYGLFADWEGTGSRIYYAKIEGAGKAIDSDVPKTCGNGTIDGKQGAIIFNLHDPKTPFPPMFDPIKFTDITNTTITKSAGHGIVRGWSSDLMAPDFTSAGKMNVFEMVAGCAQTNPQSAGGMCSNCSM